MGLYERWCGSTKAKDKRKHYWTSVERMAAATSSAMTSLRLFARHGSPEEAEAGMVSMGIDVNELRFVPLTEPAQWVCP